MTESIKDEAHRLVDQLPDSASWDELMEQIWIRQSIEAGIADSEAGRTTSVEEIREPRDQHNDECLTIQPRRQ